MELPLTTRRTSRKSASRKQRMPERDPNIRIVSFDEAVNDVLALFSELGLASMTKRRDARSTPNSVKMTFLDRRQFPNTLAISDLLTIWHQDVSYLDSSGKPLPLKMRSSRTSFRSLANKAVPDMTAAQLLTELKRLKAVRVDAKGLIHVRKRSLQIYKDRRHRVIHTLNSLRGFINTLRHNLQNGSDDSKYIFHRVAWNCDFDANNIPRLKIWLERYGQALLESADGWMLKNSTKFGQTTKKVNSVTGVSVGVYLSIDTS